MPRVVPRLHSFPRRRVQQGRCLQAPPPPITRVHLPVRAWSCCGTPILAQRLPHPLSGVGRWHSNDRAGCWTCGRRLRPDSARRDRCFLFCVAIAGFCRMLGNAAAAFFVIWRRRHEKTLQPQPPAKQQACTVPPPVPGLPTGSSPYFGLPHAPHWISNPGGVPPPLAGVTIVPTSAEATGDLAGCPAPAPPPPPQQPPPTQLPSSTTREIHRVSVSDEVDAHGGTEQILGADGQEAFDKFNGQEDAAPCKTGAAHAKGAAHGDGSADLGWIWIPRLLIADPEDPWIGGCGGPAGDNSDGSQRAPRWGVVEIQASARVDMWA